LRPLEALSEFMAGVLGERRSIGLFD